MFMMELGLEPICFNLSSEISQTDFIRNMKEKVYIRTAKMWFLLI